MTQRIKGRGPIIAFDDITQTADIVITETGTPQNSAAIIEPQLSPKAVITGADEINIDYQTTTEIVDGFIIAGIDDPEEQIQFYIKFFGGFADIIAPPEIFFQPSPFSEKSLLINFKSDILQITGVSITIKSLQKNPAVPVSVGFVMPVKIIRDPSLSDASFEFDVIDTAVRETSQSGQMFSGAGSIRRVLRVGSGAVSPMLMYGLPKLGKEISFLNTDPTATNMTEVANPGIGIGREWEISTAGTNGSLEWPGILNSANQYILRYVATQTGAANDFSIDTLLSGQVFNRGLGFVEFSPSGSNLKIDLTGTTENQRIGIVGVSLLEQREDRRHSISNATQASRASRPVLVSLSPDDGVWAPDTTIFGIPEWQTLTHLETQSDDFRFRLVVTESL